MNPLKSSLQKYYQFNIGIHDYYLLPTKLFLSLTKEHKISRWENNREEDQARVNKIKNYSLKQGYIDGYISLAYFKTLNQLCCYDGNHRRLAVTLTMKPILTSIIWEATNDIVIEKFNAINQSISVPMIYMDNQFDAKTKLIITNFTKELHEKYPTHSSASRLCKHPNFNRDLLTENLTDLMKELTIEPELLIMYINHMNECYKNELYGFKNVTIKNDKIVQKCQTSGLWLFAQSKMIDKLYLNKIITNYNI
jgi:hypothetical protein